ncbi:ABC transporter ATP-binding protein [Leucobacter sp. BZR 635]
MTSQLTYTQQISQIEQQAGAAIRVSDTVKRYGDLTVLDHVNLDINAGEFITLLGASGSGKSTLLNIISGFNKADAGSLEIDGEDFTRKPPHKRGLGMVFQHYALFPHMSVWDNVAFGLRRQRRPKQEIQQRVGDVLRMIQMDHLADRKPDQLSGGQQQRVALARGIVFEPRVLLMDEPLGALDKLLREEMQLEIRRIHQELGITFIFVTHDQHEALTMSDRIALLRNGKIEQLGTPRELYDSPNSRYVAEFIGESNLFEGRVDGDDFVSDGGDRFGCPSGTGGLLMVRPEHVRVVSDAAGLTNALPVRVFNCVYLGSDMVVYGRAASGQVVVARAPISHGMTPPVEGDRAIMTWATEDSRLVSDQVEPPRA